MDKKTSQKLKFITIPSDILYQSNLTMVEKAFLGLVFGFSPNPLKMSNSDLGDVLNISGSGVCRLIRRLVRADWIVVEYGNSRWRNIYAVQRSPVLAEAVTTAPVQQTTSSALDTASPVQHTTSPVPTIIKEIKENNISLWREDSFSLSQVQEMIARHGLEVDAERFYDYYRGQRLSRFTLYLKLKSWHTNRSIPPPPRRKTAAELVAEYEAQQAQYAPLT